MECIATVMPSTWPHFGHGPNAWQQIEGTVEPVGFVERRLWEPTICHHLRWPHSYEGIRDRRCEFPMTFPTRCQAPPSFLATYPGSITRDEHHPYFLPLPAPKFFKATIITHRAGTGRVPPRYLIPRRSTIITVTDNLFLEAETGR